MRDWWAEHFETGTASRHGPVGQARTWYPSPRSISSPNTPTQTPSPTPRPSPATLHPSLLLVAQPTISAAPALHARPPTSPARQASSDSPLVPKPTSTPHPPKPTPHPRHMFPTSNCIGDRSEDTNTISNSRPAAFTAAYAFASSGVNCRHGGHLGGESVQCTMSGSCVRRHMPHTHTHPGILQPLRQGESSQG